MISLTINTDSMTKQDAAVLRAIADAYYPQHSVEIVTAVIVNPTMAPTDPERDEANGRTFAFGRKIPEPTLAEQFKASVEGTAARVGGTAKVIDPADNPAVGAPDQHALADQVFSGGAVPTSERVVVPGFKIDGGELTLLRPVILDSNGSSVFSGTMTATQGEPNTDAAKLGAGAAGITELDLRNSYLLGVGPDPAQVFSGGAYATGGEIPAASIPTHVVGATPSEATILPNVPSGTPTPPPLPPVTQPTLPPPLNDATTGSLPPPPPPAPAPGNASGGAPTTPPVQTDAAGLPWDARIHAGTKTMTAKGVWTRRRAIEDSTVAEVEAQLRAAMAIKPPSARLAPEAAWPFPKDSSSVGGSATPPPPTFGTLMTFITERVGAGTLTSAQVTTAVQATGLETINLVMARPDLIPAIMAELQKVPT